MIRGTWLPLASAGFLALAVGTPLTSALAQAPTQAPSAEAAQALAHDLIRGFPTIRALNAPPTVPQVGLLVRVDGGSAMIPVTAVMGMSDSRVQDDIISSLFPISQTYYPIDSLDGLKAARAAEWVTRLEHVPAAERTYAAGGWQRVHVAQLAARATNDTLALRLFNMRLAELRTHPAEQSYVLSELIYAFIDPTQEPKRLARNLVIAEKYLKMLHALPAGGYKTRQDSTSVLHRQWRTEDSIIVAYTQLGDTTAIRTHAQRAQSYIPILGINERGFPLFFIYYHVMRAFDQSPEGRAQLAAFNTIQMAMAHRAATEVPAATSTEDRTRIRNLEADAEGRIKEIMAWLALLNTPAPPISAHLWLNTPDSLYAPTPRTQSMADGKVHVLLYGYFYNNDRISIASRTQQKFPSGVQMLLVTRTTGIGGPDILNPKEESAWLTKYYRGVRQLVMPTAIWAAEKEQAGYVPEGHYPVFRPKDTPNEEPYHAGTLGMSCVLIDKRGVIRFYQPVETRRDEVKLQGRIQLLLDEPAGAPVTAPATPAPPAAPAPPAPSSAAPKSASAASPVSSAAVAMTLTSSVNDHGTH